MSTFLHDFSKLQNHKTLDACHITAMCDLFIQKDEMSDIEIKYLKNLKFVHIELAKKVWKEKHESGEVCGSYVSYIESIKKLMLSCGTISAFYDIIDKRRV